MFNRYARGGILYPYFTHHTDPHTRALHQGLHELITNLMNSPVFLKDSGADQETEWLSIMRVTFERKDDANRSVLCDNAESSGDFEKEPGQTFVLQWKYSRASGEILVVVPGLATIPGDR